MRIGLVQITQETSSFNPTLTTLADFESFGIYEGDEILERLRSAGPIGGYVAGIETSGVDVETVPIIRAAARSGGRLTLESFEYFNDKVRTGLQQAGDLDGVVMLLHGAASAEGIDDVEGELLKTARQAVGSAVPIAVMLDHHANVTQAMVDHSNVIVGFRTQPHDQFETAQALTELAVRLFSREITPTTAWRKLPMLTHQEQYLTSGGPMKTLFDRARQMEDDPSVLTVSPFPMQCWLDADEGGWSMIVVTDDDPELAEHLADELAELAWSMRADFQRTESVPVDEAVLAADRASDGPVIVSDTGDSVLGGSGGDSTVLLEAMLRLGIDGPALIPMIDPIAAAELAQAGVGATVTLDIGGRSAPLFFHPVTVTGVVSAVADGVVELTDHAETEIDMGDTVAFTVGPVTLLVTEFAGVAGIHPAVYRHVGIEPADFQILVMKTASNFQYMTMASAMIRAATPGPTQSDIAALPWERIPRPCFPMESLTSWRG